MQERIVDIIVLVMGKFRQQVGEKYADISKGLLSKGYTENEINLAFSWIFNHIQDKDRDNRDEFVYASGSNRVLHEVEKLIFTADAYGYLLQLRHLNLITDPDLEVVIDRALSIGTSTIEADDVKSIAASILFGSDGNSSIDGYFYNLGSNTIH